jgi:ribosomal protein L7/L12
MSEAKDTIEDAGETMKRDTKKAGHRMEEEAEEAKDKID